MIMTQVVTTSITIILLLHVGLLIHLSLLNHNINLIGLLISQHLHLLHHGIKRINIMVKKVVISFTMSIGVLC